MKYPLSKLYLTREAKDHAIEAIEAEWTSGTGAAVSRFEKMVADHADRKYAVACSNGTAALRVALTALGIGAGDEVIVPALTFVAPAAMVKMVGATPVFADVHPSHWTLDPAEVEAQITPRTKAIIAVDVLGHPCDYSRLVGLCGSRGIHLIEDAAEAHGAFYKDHPTGAFGVISTFSFHSNKGIPIGESGAILTDDFALYEKMRVFINHGMTPENPYWHPAVGDNCRLSNVLAAIGVGQYENWDALIEARQEIAEWYDTQMEWMPDFQCRPVAKWATEATWLYTLTHPERDRIVEMLRASDIDARAIWTALPNLPPYQAGVRGDYPVAQKIAAEAFWLPTYAGLRKKDVKHIAGVLGEALRKLEKVAI
jgi:perosamine synthetase